MSQVISRIWRPVKRRGAQKYLQITVLSFAASVSLTRLILEVTGYPQLGNDTLHIAHVLYGGVILYAASLMPLLYANRWAYTWGSILSGVGVGLFIDEVGKFITQSNDYFFPLAAPIIYVFFLLTVLVYIRIKDEPGFSVRDELYTILEILQEALDHELDSDEHEDLIRRLDHIQSEARNADYLTLASSIGSFVEGDAFKVVPDEENLFDRLILQWNVFEERFVTETRLRWLLIVGFFMLGLPSFQRFSAYLMVIGSSLDRNLFLTSISNSFPSSVGENMYLALGFVLLDGASGLTLALSSLFLVVEHKNWATQLSSSSLIFALVVVNILLFYIEQFSWVPMAILQYLLLQTVYYYQRKYVKKSGRSL